MMKNIQAVAIFLLSLYFSACVHIDDKLRGYPYFELEVVPGDTFVSLGRQFDVPWKFIAYVNDIPYDATLLPGQILKIPQTETAWASPAVRQRLAQQQAKQEQKSKPAIVDASPSSTKSSFANLDYLYWPVKGSISSHFGPRQGRMHEGIDIRAARGTEIRAAAAGRVIFAGWQRGYGQTVILEHEQFRTLYAHCSKIKVKKGEWIDRGSLIARVGATGRATGPHLHFEIRTMDGKAINPVKREIAGLFRY